AVLLTPNLLDQFGCRRREAVVAPANRTFDESAAGRLDGRTIEVLDSDQIRLNAAGGHIRGGRESLHHLANCLERPACFDLVHPRAPLPRKMHPLPSAPSASSRAIRVVGASPATHARTLASRWRSSRQLRHLGRL